MIEHILICISSIVLMLLLFSFFVTICHLFCYRKGLMLNDLYKCPLRLIRNIIMNSRESAKYKLKQYMILRKCIENLDIPIRERDNLLFDLRRMESISLIDISDDFKKAILNQLKSEIEKDELK